MLVSQRLNKFYCFSVPRLLFAQAEWGAMPTGKAKLRMGISGNFIQAQLLLLLKNTTALFKRLVYHLYSFWGLFDCHIFHFFPHGNILLSYGDFPSCSQTCGAYSRWVQCHSWAASRPALSSWVAATPPPQIWILPVRISIDITFAHDLESHSLAQTPV